MSGNTDFIRLYTETEDGLQAAFYQANDDYLQIWRAFPRKSEEWKNWAGWEQNLCLPHRFFL